MKYFTKLDDSIHPKAKQSEKNIYTNNIKLKNSKKNYNTAVEVYKIFSKYLNKNDLYGGTWQWIDKKKRKDVFNFKSKKELNLPNKNLSNFFRNNLSFGLISSHWENRNSRKWKNKLSSQILKNILSWEEFTKNKNSDMNYLNDFGLAGNPYGLKLGKKLIMYDTPRHDYYADKIITLLKNKKIPTILEIGGGYGGLLAQLIKRKYKFNYINIDIPKSLMVSYYFIRSNFSKKILINERIKLKKIKKNSIIFVPFTKNFNWESNLEIDLVFNSNSFSELDNKILNYYLKLINTKIIPKFILHQNSNILLYPNSKRHIEILASKFKINKKKFRKVSSGLSLFQGGSGRYREYLYVRNDIL